MDKYYLKEILLGVIFIMFVFGFEYGETYLVNILKDYEPTVVWTPLYMLARNYILAVLASSAIATLLAVSLGILVHVKKMEQLKVLMMKIGDFGTAFPTVAMIALLVPVLGYGYRPVMVALVLYSLLPILTNTIGGLAEVDATVISAAEGMGMSSWQQLQQVELPLAMPIILAGLRTSVIINIAAATVGAVVGASGLGTPIVSGIRTNEPILIIKGAIPVALLAGLADRFFYRLEEKYKW